MWLPAQRVRAMLRLVKEVEELGGSTEAAREHLIAGLVELVGAALGAMVPDTTYDPAARATSQAPRPTLVNFDDATMGIFEHSLRPGSALLQLHAAALRRLACSEDDVVTATHLDVLPAEEWSRSSWVNDVVRPVGIDHFLSSVRRLGPGLGEPMGLLRELGDPPFTEEDRVVVDLVRHECPGLFPAPSKAVHLAPRVREALALLLTGLSDKEIAQRMDISRYTVREYLKVIFMEYGVTTRAELIARWDGVRSRPLRS